MKSAKEVVYINKYTNLFQFSGAIPVWIAGMVVKALSKM